MLWHIKAKQLVYSRIVKNLRKHLQYLEKEDGIQSKFKRFCIIYGRHV